MECIGQAHLSMMADDDLVGMFTFQHWRSEKIVFEGAGVAAVDNEGNGNRWCAGQRRRLACHGLELKCLHVFEIHAVHPDSCRKTFELRLQIPVMLQHSAMQSWKLSRVKHQLVDICQAEETQMGRVEQATVLILKITFQKTPENGVLLNIRDGGNQLAIVIQQLA